MVGLNANSRGGRGEGAGLHRLAFVPSRAKSISIAIPRAGISSRSTKWHTVVQFFGNVSVGMRTQGGGALRGVGCLTKSNAKDTACVLWGNG